MAEALTEVRVSEPRVHVSLMTAEQYAHYWPSIEKELDKVAHIWEPWYTKQYLRDIPLHQELLVWETGLNGAVRVVIFAHFIQTPRGRGLQFVLALGNSLDAYLPQLEALYERLAQDFGCDFVQILGRRGWVRKLSHFKEDFVVMSRQLTKFRVQ